MALDYKQTKGKQYFTSILKKYLCQKTITVHYNKTT